MGFGVWGIGVGRVVFYEEVGLSVVFELHDLLYKGLLWVININEEDDSINEEFRDESDLDNYDSDYGANERDYSDY